LEPAMQPPPQEGQDNGQQWNDRIPNK
jgi:hypothetical protein